MPSPLSAADLVEIWDGLEEVFPSTALIQRYDKTNKVSSGTPLDIDTGAPCWFIDGGSQLPQLIASMMTTGTLRQTDNQRAVFAGRRDVKAGDTLVKGGTRYSVGRVSRDDLGIAAIADVEAAIVERR